MNGINQPMFLQIKAVTDSRIRVLLSLWVWSRVALPALATDNWDMSGVGLKEMQAAASRPLGWADLDWSHVLLNHWHNRLVHFPLVLACLLTVLCWLSLRRPQYAALVRELLFVSALLALLAAFLGQQQAMPFEGGEMSLFLLWHQILGLLSAVGLSGAAWFSQSRPEATRSLAWLMTGLLALILSTGFWGGVLASH